MAPPKNVPEEPPPTPPPTPDPPDDEVREPSSPIPDEATEPDWTTPWLHAPQTPLAAELFERADATDVSEPVLLVCKATISSRGADPFTKPEPYVDLRFGSKGSRVRSNIITSGYDGLVSAPAFGPSVGDLLIAGAWESDQARDDLIGRAETKFDGTLPFSVVSSFISMQCRGVAPAIVERELGKALGVAKERLGDLEKGPAPRISDPHFEPPAEGLEARRAARSAVRQAAALAGWNEPRVQELLTELARVEAELDRRFAGEIERVRATLPSTSTWTLGGGALRAEELGVACGTSHLRLYTTHDEKACALTGRFTNISPHPIVLGEGLFFMETMVLGRLRYSRVADLEGRRAVLGTASIETADGFQDLDTKGSLASGETVAVSFELVPAGRPGDRRAPEPPMLLATSSVVTRGPASAPLVVTAGRGTVTLTVRELTCSPDECVAKIELDNRTKRKLESFSDAFKGPILSLGLARGATLERLAFPDDVPFWEVKVPAKRKKTFTFRAPALEGATRDDVDLVVTHEPNPEHAWIP